MAGIKSEKFQLKNWQIIKPFQVFSVPFLKFLWWQTLFSSFQFQIVNDFYLIFRKYTDFFKKIRNSLVNFFGFVVYIKFSFTGWHAVKAVPRHAYFWAEHSDKKSRNLSIHESETEVIKFAADFIELHWADDKQSKARNSDSKYRQMALVGFDT